MLLDYKAVGVELVTPAIEERNFKDWAGYAKGKMNTQRSFNSNQIYNPKINAQESIIMRHLPQQYVMAMEHKTKNPRQKHKISTTTNAMIKGAYIDARQKVQMESSYPDKQNASNSFGLTKHDSTSPFRSKVGGKREAQQSIKQKPTQ